MKTTEKASTHFVSHVCDAFDVLGACLNFFGLEYFVELPKVHTKNDSEKNKNDKMKDFNLTQSSKRVIGSEYYKLI